MVNFYTNVLGLTVTDQGDDRIVFLSAQPETEHHEIALVKSPDGQGTNAGQISFPVANLRDLKALYRKVKDYGCQFDRVVNHGIAFGAYFRDPEANRIEIYWPTGIDYPQPYGDPIDLDADDDELMAVLNQLEPREGTGLHYYGKDLGLRRTVPSSP